MILDIHQHLSAAPDAAARLRDASLAAGIHKSVIFAAPACYGVPGNDVHLEAAARFPDFFIPFYYFRLGEEAASALPAIAVRGFRGLKLICPAADYDDESFFPVYEQAEALHLPCLFHLGIVARPQGVVVREGYSKRMRPICLDTIARCFPGLTLIGAHSGNPWLDEMAMAVRWNNNLFSDLSGSILRHRKPGFLSELYWWDNADAFYKAGASPFDKIVFGSDTAPESVASVVQDYERHFDAIGLAPEKRRRIWWDNAARILGIAERTPP